MALIYSKISLQVPNESKNNSRIIFHLLTSMESIIIISLFYTHNIYTNTNNANEIYEMFNGM